MDESTRQAFLTAADATERIALELRSAVARTTQGVPKEQQAKVVDAASAPIAALDELCIFLGRSASGEAAMGPASAPGNEIPALTREQAGYFLKDVQRVYLRIEEEILKPLEMQQLEEGERRLLRRHVGTVWAWLVSGLQDPLWRLYPDLNPNPGG